MRRRERSARLTDQSMPQRQFAQQARDVRTSTISYCSGVMNRAMLFSQAILLAEWEANAPLREATAIKRERLGALRAKGAGKQRST